jgi:hypothetical protein
MSTVFLGPQPILRKEIDACAADILMNRLLMHGVNATRILAISEDASHERRLIGHNLDMLRDDPSYVL